MHRLRLKHRRQSSDGYGPRRRGSFAGVVVEDHDVQKKMVWIGVPDVRTSRKATCFVSCECLPDQCLHSAEADVRPPRRKSGFEP